MARWAGTVGFSNQVNTSPGVWEEQVVERKYYGDIFKNTKSVDSGSQINDGISISNQISIVSDPYATENFHRILYVTFMGTKWKVSNVEVQFPRLILNAGGVYNGQ